MKIDEKNLNESIVRELEKLNVVEVVTGITDSDVAEYATANEYGIGVPTRPFMRTTQEKNKDKYIGIVEQSIYNIIDNADTESELSKLGMHMQNDIKDSIVNGKWTPNTPTTIARKGSSKPLIDKGTMLGSVHYTVRKKGKL